MGDQRCEEGVNCSLILIFGNRYARFYPTVLRITCSLVRRTNIAKEKCRRDKEFF